MAATSVPVGRRNPGADHPKALNNPSEKLNRKKKALRLAIPIDFVFVPRFPGTNIRSALRQNTAPGFQQQFKPRF